MSTATTSVLATIVANRGNPRKIRDELERASSRADDVDKWLRAFTFRPADYDVEGKISLALAGLPIGVKDLFDTADMPTTYGSRVYTDHRPAEDATIVSLIKDFGGVVFGKTATTEFAWKDPAPTVNPVNRLHTPGGSSSGSAAAVGAGIVPLAVGTQTVGSIIRPAAFCGVVGYKPTFGQVSTKGIHPLSPSLDHVGFFARTIEDVAVANALFVSRNDGALSSEGAWKRWFSDKSLRTFRLGALKTPFWNMAAAPQQANFLVVIGLLRAAGVEVVFLDIEADLRVMTDAVRTILAREAYTTLDAFVRDYTPLVSRHIRELVEEGAKIPDSQYRDALDLQTDLRLRSRYVMQDCDALLTLPTLGQAPYGHLDTGDPRCCAPWSLVGMPAVSIPSGWSADGLPLGLQLVGQFGCDLELLRVAEFVEQVIGVVCLGQQECL
ncbi:amidase [Paraburkholderia hospita]|uniref:Amidase n=1 Tax=Paraburkholderia hospita TaxID=169430 RepID=A0ABN0FCI7_9BURK|nr:amidase [Paraburkholderia hospita]EIM96367.1 amidase [Paraburkholderia hospita]OUL70167.1 amidase [Paraburkholderia hospita]